MITMFLIVHQSFHKLIKVVVQGNSANRPKCEDQLFIQIYPIRRTMNSTIYSSNAKKMTTSTRHNEFNINTRAHGKNYAGCPKPLHHWGPHVRQNRNFQFRTTFQWYNPSIFTENIYHHKKILVSFIPFAEFLYFNQISSPYFIDVIYALWVYVIHPLIFLASLVHSTAFSAFGRPRPSFCFVLMTFLANQ